MQSPYISAFTRISLAVLGCFVLEATLPDATAATIIGNNLNDSINIDAFSGQIFLLNANLSSIAGQSISSWSLFNNSNPGRSSTPLLLEDTSGNQTSFTIRGIGTTRVTSGSGQDTFTFSAVGGSSLIGANYYVGHYDGAWNGTTGFPNPGTIDFDTVNTPAAPGQIDSTGTVWLNTAGTDTPANIGVGAVNAATSGLYGGAVDTRHYSIQFTAVPEPSALGVFGLAVVGFTARRRLVA